LQALKSLQKYPLVLESAKECKVLQHFGEGLCKIIDKKLTEHIASGGYFFKTGFYKMII
jgi:crossover junction endonuclease MUS81